VRIDSGDLGEHARRVRAILDDGGCRNLTIFASGNLDEYALRTLVDGGAPIDGFGVGTRMNTSADAPYLDCAYKLQEYGGRPRRKRSEGKATWPGRKQVHRRFGANGAAVGDVVSLASDVVEGEPLLAPVIRGGRLVAPLPSLAASRLYAARAIATLPVPLRALERAPAPYPVSVAPSLHRLAAEVDARN
jgi:nicotinate phosphoribosyltransferase